MIKLDDQLVADLGLRTMPSEYKSRLLRALYDEIEMRTGAVLARRMSIEQLTEFEGLIDSGDDAAAFDWLVREFPDYKAVIQEEFEKLCGEISAQSGEFLAAVVVFGD